MPRPECKRGRIDRSASAQQLKIIQASMGTPQKIRRTKTQRLGDAGLVKTVPRKAPPYEFVLEALAPLRPRTNPMFGCLAVYAGEKIVLILRDRPAHTADNGVWLATTREYHESLRRD